MEEASIQMDRERSLELLKSNEPNERLLAARALVDTALPDDLHVIKRALTTETVVWNKEAMLECIKRLKSHNNTTGPVSDVSSEIVCNDDKSRDALEQTIEVVLHEIDNLVGRIRVMAVDAIENFEATNIRKEFDRLENRINALKRYGDATRKPKLGLFDLSEWIREIVAKEMQDTRVELTGPNSMSVRSDRGLLEIAILMGLRNAIEAVDEVYAKPETHPVVLSWGENDRETWITIIDDGPGLDIGLDAILARRKSTKALPGHSGIGLVTANRAATAIGGRIELVARREGGTRYSVVLEKTNGD
jgi:signal transduction histidine kinase